MSTSNTSFAWFIKAATSLQVPVPVRKRIVSSPLILSLTPARRPALPRIRYEVWISIGSGDDGAVETSEIEEEEDILDNKRQFVGEWKEL